jgi:hypothetical protein
MTDPKAVFVIVLICSILVAIAYRSANRALKKNRGRRRGPNCAVCKKRVEKGEGQHYAGCLIHRKCFDLAKMRRLELIGRGGRRR